MLTDNPQSPRIISRKCGGWLAVSGKGDPIQIGVTAPSEPEVREKFWAAAEGWRDILDTEKGVSPSGM